MDKLSELVANAKAIVAGDPDRLSLWHAYVSLEYAIMDLKLRHGLEGQSPPERPTKKEINISRARFLLEELDLSVDKKKLLSDLRSCRDLVKALIAAYSRRSTTS